MTYEEDARVAAPTDPNGASNPTTDMRLARAFIIKIATPRYPDYDTLARMGTPQDRMPPAQDQVPEGFVPIWGGKAAVRIEALDRDRLGAEVGPLDLAAMLVHPGPGPAPGWRTGP